jgi:putative ABC transport system permease protein
MKYLPYVLKHLRRNWIRTASTVVGMAVCIFLICTLQTVLAAIRASTDAADPGRLVTRHGVSLIFNMPLAYQPRIRAIPGVENVAVSNWFGGMYQGDMKNFFPNMAVESEQYFKIYPEFEVPPDEYKAYLQDMRGALIGKDVAEKYGFKIGDSFQLESMIPPYRVKGPMEFVVRGIYDADTVKHPTANLGMMFFHFKYLYETIQGNPRVGSYAGAGTFNIRVANPNQAAAVAKAIDANFENSDVQTKTETEGAFIAGFMALIGNLTALLNGIGLAVAFTILLVTANTMSMAIRERRTEIAVLKTLGFSSRLVMSLVMVEALALGVLGGGLGLLLAQLLVSNVGKVPVLGAILGNFPGLAVTPFVATLAFTTAVVLAIGAGVFPAVGAYRARITEMLRQV